MQPSAPFPLARYVAVILLFAPFVIVAVMWATFVIGGYFDPADWSSVKRTGAEWMTIGVGVAAVCLMSEWLVLPFVVPHKHHRPRYTPLISLAVGVAVAGVAYGLIAGVSLLPAFL